MSQPRRSLRGILPKKAPDARRVAVPCAGMPQAALHRLRLLLHLTHVALERAAFVIEGRRRIVQAIRTFADHGSSLSAEDSVARSVAVTGELRAFSSGPTTLRRRLPTRKLRRAQSLRERGPG